MDDPASEEETRGTRRERERERERERGGGKKRKRIGELVYMYLSSASIIRQA